MNWIKLAHVAMGLAVIMSTSDLAAEDQPVEEHQEEERVVSEPVVVDGLSVTVMPSKLRFDYCKPLVFEIKMENTSTTTVALSAIEFADSTTIGSYSYIIEGDDEQEWEVVRDPGAPLPGVPARMVPVTLEPGESHASRVSLPPVAMMFRRRGVEGACGIHCLPEGSYALTIRMRPLQTEFETNPAEFKVSVEADRHAER